MATGRYYTVRNVNNKDHFVSCIIMGIFQPVTYANRKQAQQIADNMNAKLGEIVWKPSLITGKTKDDHSFSEMGIYRSTNKTKIKTAKIHGYKL